MTASTTPVDRPATPLRHRVRGHVLLLLCALYAILYFDRVNISTAGPNGLMTDLGISKVEFGLATTAFALPYALLQLGGGWLGDRLGPRKGLVIAAVVCGIFTVLTGLVNGLAALLAVRFVLGLAEGAAFPTSTRAMATWFPVDRRGFAQGVVHAASRVSNALAPLIVTGLIALPHVGWRGSFVVAGIVGVAWGLIWLRYFRDRPKDHPGVGTDELRELSADAKKADTGEPVPWRRLLRRIWPVTVTDFCYGWVLWVYLTWMPSYFTDEFGLSKGTAAVLTSVTLFGGALGDWAGGWLCDTLLRHTSNLGRSRRTGLVVGLGGSALCLLPVAFVHSLLFDTVCLTAAFLLLELCNSPLWTIPMDITPEHSGTASGLMNTGFGVAGTIAPPVFGFVADQSGYGLALGVSGLLLLLGLVSVRWISVAPLRHPEIADEPA